MKKLILLMLLGLISSPLFAQQSRLVYLPYREAPVNCLYESKSYLCMDGETYLYGSDFGGDITFAGVIDGAASSMISAEKVVAESNPDEVLFEKAEPSIFIYIPEAENPEPIKPTLAAQTTSLTMTLANLNNPFNPFDKSVVDKVKAKLLSKVNENKAAYESDNRVVTLEDGSELSCKRGETVSDDKVYQTFMGSFPLQCELFDCKQTAGENKGKSFSLISNPDPNYPFSSLFSVDEKGLPHYIQPEQIDIVGVDKPLFKKIKPFKMLDAGDYAPYGQMPQGMIDMNYQKPQITMDMTAPNLGDSEINAVANMTSMGLENQIKMNLDACSPDAYKPLLDSFNKLEDAILNNELVQYVTELNSGLAGFYLSPQDIPEFACSKDGVYYNRKVFEDAQSVRSEQSIEDVAITPEEAQKLFDMAQGMEDIAWGYKMDGCYARAHLMARRFEELGYKVDKAWLKGNLTAKDDEGKPIVQWNFHVAPVVYVKQEDGSVEKVVIDPSIEKKPVPASEWAGKLSDDVKGGVVDSVFPYPENAGVMMRNALAFSSSQPYLPMESVELAEETKMSMADETMVRYKAYEKGMGQW